MNVRLIAALAYAAGACALVMGVLPRSAATAPGLMILLGLPLVFRLVPRNYLYGMRSPRTLWTTEDTWYRQNVITGVAMVGVGIAWLATLGITRLID
jgi:hypothetical protein